MTLPSSNPVDQSSIWERLRVTLEPLELDSAGIITAPRLGEHIATLAVPTKQATYRRSTNAKHRRGRFVRPCLSTLIRRNDTPPKID